MAEADCTAITGCEWKDMKCAKVVVPPTCASAKTDADCTAVSGCEWKGTKCEAKIAECSLGMAEPDCTAIVGCIWDAPNSKCTGTACPAKPEAECNAPCGWDSVKVVCATAVVNECTVLFEEAKCRAKGSCLWGVNKKCSKSVTPTGECKNMADEASCHLNKLDCVWANTGGCTLRVGPPPGAECGGKTEPACMIATACEWTGTVCTVTAAALCEAGKVDETACAGLNGCKWEGGLCKAAAVPVAAKEDEGSDALPYIIIIAVLALLCLLLAIFLYHSRRKSKKDLEDLRQADECKYRSLDEELKTVTVAREGDAAAMKGLEGEVRGKEGEVREGEDRLAAKERELEAEREAVRQKEREIELEKERRVEMVESRDADERLRQSELLRSVARDTALRTARANGTPGGLTGQGATASGMATVAAPASAGLVHASASPSAHSPRTVVPPLPPTPPADRSLSLSVGRGNNATTVRRLTDDPSSFSPSLATPTRGGGGGSGNGSAVSLGSEEGGNALRQPPPSARRPKAYPNAPQQPAGLVSVGVEDPLDALHSRFTT